MYADFNQMRILGLVKRISTQIQANMEQFDHHAITEAYQRIRDHIHRTPVFTSSTVDRMVGCKIYFKSECLQKTGSFKARGALNSIFKLKAEKNVDHVITHSSGNHGQALAFAAKHAGVKCTVVVPDNAPKVKVDAIEAYAANIVTCQSTMSARISTCEKIMQETGAVLVHPHNDLNVMAGQGTIALEFIEQVPSLDAILVPVGGGGMISGIAAWVKYANPICKVFAVEPHGKQLSRGLSADRFVCDDSSKLLDTVADGMRIPGIGELCFPVMSRLLEKEVFTVTDKEIIDAMKLVYQHLKLVIEPSSATGVAALFTDRFRALQPTLKNVGVILCGGNTDLDKLPWIVK